MAESTHVFGPWYAISAYQEQRKCIRCGYVQTRNYITQPS